MIIDNCMKYVIVNSMKNVMVAIQKRRAIAENETREYVSSR